MPRRELSVLREDALALSEAERAILAHDLVASLDGPAEQDVSDAWDREIIRRINEIDSGNTTLFDASEVISDIRKRIS
ncbi:MAG: addiction module protein [Gammaproteobacteria bacterium]|nr:addiction module protein [Gammaproteobacteria bacterium]HXK56086.1 addiction module protein [Gammaproteobacteria bacterium]